MKCNQSRPGFKLVSPGPFFTTITITPRAPPPYYYYYYYYYYYISFQDMQSIFWFLVSLINHYHINGLHLFWDSFEWFCLQISNDTKYFSSLVQRYRDRGLVIAIAYYWPCGQFLPLARKTGVPSQVESYERLKKWYLMPSWLTLSIVR